MIDPEDKTYTRTFGFRLLEQYLIEKYFDENITGKSTAFNGNQWPTPLHILYGHNVFVSIFTLLSFKIHNLSIFRELFHRKWHIKLPGFESESILESICCSIKFLKSFIHSSNRYVTCLRNGKLLSPRNRYVNFNKNKVKYLKKIWYCEIRNYYSIMCSEARNSR